MSVLRWWSCRVSCCLRTLGHRQGSEAGPGLCVSIGLPCSQVHVCLGGSYHNASGLAKKLVARILDWTAGV